MSQAGYTPIQLYFSTTAAAVPVNTNLADGELAINITDGKLYYKDNGGTVRLLASNATSAPVLSFSAGTTGFTPSTATTGAVTLAGTLATTNGGTGLTSFTSGGVVYASSSSALATGSAMTFSGSQLAVIGTASFKSIYSTTPSQFTTLNYDGISVEGAQDAYYSAPTGRSQFWYLGATQALTLTPTSLYTASGIKVGIGHSNPQYALDVGATSDVNISMNNSTSVTSGNRGTFSMYNSAGSTVGFIRFGAVTDNSGTDIQFGVRPAGGSLNSTAMRLDSAGNLGLGVTPSAWSTGKGIEVGFAGSGIYSYSQTDTEFLSNAYYNAGYKFGGTGRAMMYAMGTAGSGIHSWHISSASGTAGTAISFTQAMTLAADGNLLLGTTTSPSYSGYTTLVLNSATNGGLLDIQLAGSRIGSLQAGSSTELRLFANTSVATTFYGGGSERLRIASTGAFGLSGANYGSSGQVLTSGGSGAAPTWTTVSGGGGSAATPTVSGTVFGSMTASGASPYLTALGYNAGAANTGARNVFIGVSAGQANLAGGDSIAIGYEAMKNYTESNGNNIAIGTQALSTATSGSSYYNIAIGHEAMKSNTSGYINTAVGWRALFSNTTGRYSTAVGYQALYLLQSGNDGSTAVGANAGSSITTGIYNVMVGGSSIASVTTGSYNTAMGYNALGSAATTSSSNTAFGYNALAAGGVKDGNVAIGRDAMIATTGGGNNVAVGREALTQNTTSANNVSIGYRSLFSVTTASGNHVAVGYEALYSATDNSNVAVGYRAGYGVTSGHNNVLLGINAGNSTVVLAGGAQNVVIGSGAYTNTTGAYNEIVIGQSCNGVGSDYVTIGKINNRVYNHYDTNATWIQASDARLKKDIEEDSLGLSFINKLRPVKYRWKATNELELDNPQYNEVNNKNTTVVMHGLIAQEVKAVLDEEGVDTFGGWHVEPNGIQGVSREMFITPLINAVQELTAQIETLKAEVATLKGNV